MNSGTVWACSHWNSLPWWAKTAAVLGCGVPACFFFLPRKRLQGLQPLWKTRGTQQSTSKWLVLLHTDLLPSRGCQGASLMQKRRWGTEGNNKKPQNTYIFNLNHNPVWVTRKKKANTVGLTGSTYEGKNLKSGFMNEIMGIKWKLCAFARTILFLFFSLWLCCFLCILWGQSSSPVFETQQTLKQNNPRPPTKSFTGGLR